MNLDSNQQQLNQIDKSNLSPKNGSLCITKIKLTNNFSGYFQNIQITFVAGSNGFIESNIQELVLKQKIGESSYLKINNINQYPILQKIFSINEHSQQNEYLLKITLLEWADFIDISPNKTGDVLVVIQDKETSWDTPNYLSEVEISCLMTNENCKVIEDYSRKYLKFIVDEGEVLDGIELVVQHLTLTSSAYAILKGPYVWKGNLINNEQKNTLSKIKYNTLHLQDLKLISLNQAKQPCELNLNEKKERAKDMNISGNNWYKKKEFDRAIHRYQMGIDSIEYLGGNSTPEDYNSVLETLVQLNLNLAQCFISIKNFDKALYYSDEVLKLNKDSAKAYYRKIKALESIGKLDEAERICHDCICLFPNIHIFKKKLIGIEKKYLEDKDLIKTYKAFWK